MGKRKIILIIIGICSILLIGFYFARSTNKELIELSIKNGTLTNTKATLQIIDKSKTKHIFGEWFRIDKYDNGKFREAKRVVDEDVFFNAIGYQVNDLGMLEIEHDWSWLYGKLDKGKYRLVKEVNGEYFSVAFEIE